MLLLIDSPVAVRWLSGERHYRRYVEVRGSSPGLANFSYLRLQVLPRHLILIIKENILVANCGRARLADAGVNTLATRAFCDATKPVPVAWMYKAPEELQTGPVTNAPMYSHSLAL